VQRSPRGLYEATDEVRPDPPAARHQRVISELADLWFHSYLLLAARGLDPSDVERELKRRRR